MASFEPFGSVVGLASSEGVGGPPAPAEKRTPRDLSRRTTIARMRLPATCALFVLSSGVAACSSSEEQKPAPPPVTATLSTMSVRLEPEPLRVVVTARDGRVLFDGLPPRAIAAPNDDADPPPLTGIAVRSVETRVQALYGSYQFTDTGTQWRSARRAANVKSDGKSLSFDANDDAGKVASVAISAEDDGEIAITVTAAPSTSGRTWTSIAAKCADDDHFLGFGGQARDVDHRGTIVPNFVSEPGIGKRDNDDPLSVWYLAGTRHASSYPAAIYLAKSGYIGALDSPSRSVFGMCAEEESLRITADSQTAPFVFRIFDGPLPKQALTRSTKRFGRPRVPPRLAFAPWNDAILGSAKVLEYAKLLRDKDIPSSAIWYEDWRGGKFVGDDYKLDEEWDVDPALYPDLPKLIADLHDQGFASFTYFNTFVEKDLNIWKETAPNGHLVKKADGSIYEFTNVKQKPSGLIDLTNPAAKKFVTDKLRANLAIGADGWMGDFAEWLPLDAKLADGSDPWSSHNLYPQQWAEAQRAALDADDLGPTASPKARRLTFMRSGWLRSAPLPDVVWAGDQATDLSDDDGLPTVVRMGLGLSIAGVSTYGSDIAGYQVALRAPATKEVFFRWTELGAWSPVMRTHHSTQPLKNWNLASDEESTQHYRKYAILHQQLTPYFEALAKEAHETGVTIWRHLAVEFPNDPRAWKTHDELMVGPSILVAPVMQKGATSRKVYLPPGEWYAWGSFAKGGDVAAALDQIPVYVRAGSIIPMYPDTLRTVIAEAKGLVRDVDLADDRHLLVAPGPDTVVKEASGLEYKLVGVTTSSGALTWNGAPVTPDGTGVVRVTGPGKLGIGSGSLEIVGGSATRKLSIELE